MNERGIDDLEISFHVAGRWQNGNGQMDLRTGKKSPAGGAATR